MARSHIITALDIGSSKIAAVIAQKSESTGKVNVVGAASIPSRGVRKGQIVNIEEVTSAVITAVESAERMAGISINQLYANIGGQNISSQNSQGVVAIANPEGEVIPDDVIRVVEAAQAISLPSSKEIIHVLPMSFAVDSQAGIRDPVGMSGVRLEVATHIITAASTLARNLTKCVSEIGASLDQLVYSGLASAYSVLSETEKELGVVLVDIGGGTTDIGIYVEGSLAYSAVIPVGAKNVTNDLAIGLRVSLESAEKIKLFLGEYKPIPVVPEPSDKKLSNRDKKKKEDLIDLSSLNLKEEVGEVSRRTLVDGIITPRLNEIFDLVNEHVKRSGLSHAVPSGLVICGGGANTIGLVDAAKRRISLPVRVGSPNGLSGLVEDISSPAYATTIGLIMYGIENQIQHEAGFGMSMKSNKATAAVGGIAGRVMDVIKSLLP